MTANVLGVVSRFSLGKNAPSPTDGLSHPKESKLYRFKQTLIPLLDKPLKIPSHIKYVVGGVQGFFSDHGGIVDFEKNISDDEILYVPADNFLHLGFTYPITRYVPVFTDALAQAFGGQIQMHAQSGGGFQAIYAAAKNPGTVSRLNFTVVPHLLTLDPEDLREHTNIASLVGLMTKPGMKRFFDQSMITGWRQYLRGEDSEMARQIAFGLDNTEIISWGASRDTTIDTQATRFENSHNRRFLVFDGDHSDSARQAGPSIRYLVPHPLHSNIPAEYAQGLVSEDAIQPFAHRRTPEVAFDFIESAHPDKRAVRVIHTAYNAPATFRGQVQGLRESGLHLGRSRGLAHAS